MRGVRGFWKNYNFKPHFFSPKASLTLVMFLCSNELRRGREDAVRRIEGYHRHIDNCTAEMREFNHNLIQNSLHSNPT